MIHSFLKMAVHEAGLEVERAEEIDRREEREAGIDWRNLIENNADGDEIHEGIEEERRRWLVYVVLKWPAEKRAG